MSKTSRRVFLAQSAALLPTAQVILGAGETSSFRALGVQLYTVRNVILKDPAATLKAIQDIGYSEAEVTYATLDQIWPALKETSLKPVSAHVDGTVLTDADKVDGALSGLKEKGFQYVVYPYVAKENRGDLDTYRRLAATFNKIGERAKSAGLTFCYHNHAFEFEPMGGTMPIQIMLDQTDKSLVSLELDIFWVSVAGHDPVMMLKHHGDRVQLLHLKDKAKGFAVQYNETVPKDTFKEVGNGSVDIPAVLKAASQSSVKHYFVEQDQTAGDPVASLKQSYKYLSAFLNK